MAKAAGFVRIDDSSDLEGLQSSAHRTATFKSFTDPLFVEKAADIVGLLPSPPERALILCVDEKSQIEGLDRPLPPIRRDKSSGGPTTIRHGAFLFTALDAATGMVIGRRYSRHRGREFLGFLCEIERHVPPELEARLITDNDTTQKTPTIRKSLGARPRWRVHFAR